MKKAIYLISAVMMGGLTAHAGAISQIGHSGAGAGVADAFAATASDASAIAYNPAGMAWLPGVTVTGGISLNYRDSSVKVPAGIGTNAGTDPSIAHIYATWAPLDSRWGAGFGFAPLYQLNNDWSAAFPSLSANKVMVDHASFDTVYAVSSSLAIAAGFDWYITRATMVQAGNSFDDSDFASFGGHASLMWKPAPAWSAALVYRSGAKVSVSGVSSQKLAFKLPDEVTAAIAHDLTDAWRLEVDVRWSRWSAMKEMNVTGAAGVVQSNTLNLRDTVNVMAGLTWTWYPESQLRFGYAYDQGANKTSGYNPLVADQDGHRTSIGFGGDVMGVHMDAAYSYTFYTKKTVTGTYAGTYRDRKQALVLSLTKSFN